MERKIPYYRLDIMLTYKLYPTDTRFYFNNFNVLTIWNLDKDLISYGLINYFCIDVDGKILWH